VLPTAGGRLRRIRLAGNRTAPPRIRFGAASRIQKPRLVFRRRNRRHRRRRRRRTIPRPPTPRDPVRAQPRSAVGGRLPNSAARLRWLRVYRLVNSLLEVLRSNPLGPPGDGGSYSPGYRYLGLYDETVLRRTRG